MERRRNLGLTQSDLAKRWQVPQATISRWESGKHKIEHSAILADAIANIEKESGNK